MKNHEIIAAAYHKNMLNRIENYRLKRGLIAIGFLVSLVGVALAAHYENIFHACINSVAVAYFVTRYQALVTALNESIYLMPHSDIEFRIERMREIVKELTK